MQGRGRGRGQAEGRRRGKEAEKEGQARARGSQGAEDDIGASGRQGGRGGGGGEQPDIGFNFNKCCSTEITLQALLLASPCDRMLLCNCTDLKKMFPV